MGAPSRSGTREKHSKSALSRTHLFARSRSLLNTTRARAHTRPGSRLLVGGTVAPERERRGRGERGAGLRVAMSSPTGSSPSWRSMPGLAPLKTRRPSAHLRRPETAAELEYVSVGCNRSVHGADWNHEDAPGGGLVAYGAHKAVAVYDPAGARVLRTLPAHDAPVTVVRWIPDAHAPGRWLVSGDADGAVILWHRTDHPACLPDDAGSGADGDDASAGDAERPLDPEAHRWRAVAKRKAHEGPVLDARAERAFARGDPTSVRLLVTASQDGQVRLWRLDLALAPAPAPAPASAATDAAAARSRRARAARRAGRLGSHRRAPLSAALAARRAPTGSCRGRRRGRRRAFVSVRHRNSRARATRATRATARRDGNGRRRRGVRDAHGARRLGPRLGVRRGRRRSGTRGGTPGLLLASASQDRTARVWRVRVAFAAADDGSASVEGRRPVPATRGWRARRRRRARSSAATRASSPTWRRCCRGTRTG